MCGILQASLAPDWILKYLWPGDTSAAIKRHFYCGFTASRVNRLECKSHGPCTSFDTSISRRKITHINFQVDWRFTATCSAVSKAVSSDTNCQLIENTCSTCSGCILLQGRQLPTLNCKRKYLQIFSLEISCVSKSCKFDGRLRRLNGKL